MFRNEKAKKCPLLNKPCIQHECQWYTQMIGKDPSTGADFNEFDCSIKWLPVLLIENSKETRQAAAATESFRNEYKKAAGMVSEALTNAVNNVAIESK